MKWIQGEFAVPRQARNRRSVEMEGAAGRHANDLSCL